eukprot:gene44227-4941_t
MWREHAKGAITVPPDVRRVASDLAQILEQLGMPGDADVLVKGGVRCVTE